MKIASKCICCESGAIVKTPAILAPFVADRIFGWAPVEVTADWGFRDIPNGNAMSRCATVSCQECGALFVDMRFDEEELTALYADYRGSDYTSLRETYEPGYRERNETLKQKQTYIPFIEEVLRPYMPARPIVLDWGGDVGLNTPFAAVATRHDVYDISGKETVGRARQINADSVASDYDLVVCCQVLEHVAEPLILLRQISAIMSSSTLLYVDVPHEVFMKNLERGDAIPAQKRHWHEHVNFFTPGSLEMVAAKAGLDIVSVGRIPIIIGDLEGEGLYLIARKIP